MINGTSIVIQNINGEIVGQMEMTLSFVGAPIDITNKSFDQWVEIFESELGIKQLQISGSIVYNNDEQYRKVRHDAFNGNLDTYIINYVSNSSIVEIFTASMMPNGLSDAIPHGDKLTTSLTFLSSGPVQITQIIPVKIGDIFNVDLYTGNGGNQDIINGLDFESQGGIVWVRDRVIGWNSMFSATDLGVNKQLITNTGVITTFSNAVTGFNSDGYSIGNNNSSNFLGDDIVGWSFRRSPKFLDTIAYSGDGSSGRQILHNLGIQAGLCIIKNTSDSSKEWAVQHVSRGSSALLQLDNSSAETVTTTAWDNTPMDSSIVTLGNLDIVNSLGDNYLMMVFAHDPNGFIQCGEYIGNDSTSNIVVLGWRLQYIMIKSATIAGGWIIFDTARGIDNSGNDARLYADSPATESSSTTYLSINSTGFELKSNNPETNSLNETYIYIAIIEEDL